MVDGETISDYHCDSCNKRVDISRRTLISQTPNVLVVHLQRILFNFDSMKNDKLNSYFEFPFELDLKPFSFYEVMGNEKRLPKAPAADQDEEEDNPKNNDAEDTMWPA